MISQSKRGFTLIELLVVIAIIAVLAGLLFPAFQRALVSGRAVRSMGNLRQIAAAMILFSNDHDGSMVSEGGIYVNINGTSQTGWRNLSLQYMSPTMDAITRNAIFLSPNAEKTCTGGNNTNYSAHPWLSGTNEYKAIQVKKPGSTVMVAEGTTMTSSAFFDANVTLFTDWLGASPNAINNGLPAGVTDPNLKLAGDDGIDPGNNHGSKFSYRNGGLGIAAMFDGSVRQFQKGELSYGDLTWQR